MEGHAEEEDGLAQRPQFAQHDARGQRDAVHLVQVVAHPGHHRFRAARGPLRGVAGAQGQEGRQVGQALRAEARQESDDARGAHLPVGPVVPDESGPDGEAFGKVCFMGTLIVKIAK